MTKDQYKGLKITVEPQNEDESSTKLAAYFKSELKKTNTIKDVEL